MRLLLLSDSKTLAQSLRGILNDVHPVLIETDRREEACNQLQSDIFDLLILDLDMASVPAQRVLDDCPSRVFTLAIGSAASKSKILSAVQAGANDFVLKPLDPTLFRLRVGMAQAHSQAHTVEKSQIRYGRLSYNVAYNCIELDGKFLSLSPNEATILLALMRRGSSPVNKEFISRLIAGDDEYASNAAVEVSIHRLRRKLVDADVAIETIRGVGYALRIKNGSPVENPSA